MPKQIWAITTCRVSSPEQLKNNSLDNQAKAVLQAAKTLGALIPEDGQWSGSVSSKAGTNTKRKDLKDMLTYCKKHPQVKYLLVHEVDRFMRSVDELFYFEVRFREEAGVKVYYASQPELNTDDYKAKLFKALEAFKGEGSNDERQRKSINGQNNALRQGRWTFNPKPGYKKGQITGVPEIYEPHGLPLQAILNDIAGGRLALSQGLVEYNKVRVAVGKCPIRMDKFRNIVKDPFYAAFVKIDKQVQVDNKDGRHDPLITIDTHYKLVKIVENKKKNQSGPRKNGNPKYPANNLVTHDVCLKQGCGRLVGFDHGNGKNPNVIYEKYRCRTKGCGRYWKRDEIHAQIEQLFVGNPITDQGVQDLTKALNIVWERAQGQAEQEEYRIASKIKSLSSAIEQQVEAATDPSNAIIKEKILTAISNKEAEVSELEGQLERLRITMNSDRERFLDFAFGFIENMGSKFLEISQDNRLQCKQIIFPAGFRINTAGKVYTPEISPLYSLATNKKDTEVSDFTQMVRVKGL